MNRVFRQIGDRVRVPCERSIEWQITFQIHFLRSLV
jgi:hypothetical protein